MTIIFPTLKISSKKLVNGLNKVIKLRLIEKLMCQKKVESYKPYRQREAHKSYKFRINFTRKKINKNFGNVFDSRKIYHVTKVQYNLFRITREYLVQWPQLT